ncbi:MAG: hypothetical protein ACOVQ0_04620 [Novosphingobium sp.]|uniref:hypothetical protein n=1 Tax=Novosphingobium sp. TaxID=1874826 RepID=UPI003B9CAB52
MRIVKALALISAFALLPLAAHAADDKEKWETKAVADKPQVVLNPAKAYIAVQGDYQVNPLLMKRPNAEEAAKHTAKRAEELAKEHEKWVKKHASWEREMAVFAKSPPSVKRPTEPQEPTEANFSWPRYEQVHPVYIGPQNRFAKAEGGASTYLQEVEPGEYVFYGSVMMGVAGGICACLGTVAFKADAGKITSLGKMRLPWIESLRGPKETRAKNSLELPEGTTSLAFAPAVFSDPRVPADMVVAARFTPIDRMPNWFGLEVDRVMPIEGVMRYDRDKVVDLTVPAATAVQAAPAAR